MGKSLLLIILLFTNFFNLAWADENQKPYVDTMIVVAVDVSGSIDDKEYKLQKDGIIKAFSDPSVQLLLSQCSNKGIGITYVEWSGLRKDAGYLSEINPFVQVIPWTILRSPQDLTDFANQISASQRASRGDTDIAGSLSFAQKLFLKSPFQSENRIVSLSTDGFQSMTIPGVSTEDYLKMERDRLASLGITINGLAIERPFEPSPSGVGAAVSADESIEVYLNNNVRSGLSSFVISVRDFVAYGESFKKQLYVMMNACIS